MQSSKIFIRNTLWYFIPFLVMTVVAIISQDYIFRMIQSQNYEIIKNQLIQDMDEIEIDIYSSKKIALEMSMDDSLSEENMKELGQQTRNAINRIRDYRSRMNIYSALFVTYSPQKIYDENGITSMDIYCKNIQNFSEESTVVLQQLMEGRQDASLVLESTNGIKSIFLLYYFPADIHENERWIGFLIAESKIKSRMQSILKGMDCYVILNYGEQLFFELKQLSKSLSESEMSHFYEMHESGNGNIGGYTIMLHQGNLSNMKMNLLLNNSIFTKTVRKEQIRILAISVLAFGMMACLLWFYGKFQYKKMQAVQLLAVNMYPELKDKDFRGEYEMVQKVLERDLERLVNQEQMLRYFRKETKKQITGLLLKSSFSEEIEIEELLENCAIHSDGFYYTVMDFMLVREEGNLDFLDSMDNVLMYYLDKSEFGMLLMVVVALQSRDERHEERLAFAEKLLPALKAADYVCRGIACGLVYEQLIEIHSSQEEAFSLLDALVKEKKSEQTRILFFDEVVQMSKRVPHITSDILQQFREALLEENGKAAKECLYALLSPSKEIAEELITFVRYKIIQIMLDVLQMKGIDQDVINNLLYLVKVEDDTFKSEVEKYIEILHTQVVPKAINVKDVLDYITEHALDSEISVTAVADFFGISERSISRIMKDNLNKSYKEYISERRLNKACEMLRESNLQIKTIAIQVGYYNVISFNKAFKQMYGLSPGEYRIQENSRQV